RTARLVYARVYLATADMHGSEDLVQETYLLAWRRIGELTDPNAFRAWLLKIADSVVIDAARRASRKKRSGKSAKTRLDRARRGQAGAVNDVADAAPSPVDLA